MESYEKVATGLILAAMMATAGLLTYVWANPEPATFDNSGGLLSTFSNRGQVFDFLRSSEQSGWSHYDSGSRLSMGFNEQLSSSPSYSRTNVQVAGVDEMDTVKTDGKYIYIASWDAVSILNAYPPTALENVSKINESYILGNDDPGVTLSFSGVFVLPQKLIVVCSWYQYEPTIKYDSPTVARLEVPTDNYGPRSYLLVFDMSDPSQPVLDYSVGVSGYVQTARMIEDRVYLIAQQYQWTIQYETVLPRLWVGDNSVELRVDSIYYDPGMRDASSFLNLLALDVSTEEHECISVVAGYASTIYMSKQAIFLTIQKWAGEITLMNGNGVVEDRNTITTTIFKVAFDGLSMKAAARGDVKGWLLNQFSLDEKEPFLRIATTNNWWSTPDTVMANSVFILDSNLDVVGSLTDIAPTERIYSARFVGDTLYLVTFRQIDPLFVVDLRDPTNPRIVGELEMPGFSSYLHPVDATHVLGIGSESNNIKVSLYDVTDPTAPVEQSKYVLDGYVYSSSDAQYDHRAVLFDLDKNLLVIPLSATSRTTGDIGWVSSYVAGALVLDVSVEKGVSFRGIIEHKSDTQYSYEYVFRSLYIGDYLYTTSYTIVKASALSDLSEISSLVYRTYEYQYYYAL